MSGPMESGGYVQPHRGTLILVLGILGLVVCQPIGIAAWIMGNNDLKLMRAGQMDPTGEGLTSAGRIMGIVAAVLLVVTLCMIPFIASAVIAMVSAAANVQ